ncbi:ABC transporter ATP-binding protein [Streptomyces avicenniae]|uniref:ABC transporter ATP-binding protein n=1 Tax=Streptomyces avicenniae TaxID=500153 RepID=UPI000DA60055|nr:ABC transporter ATP-binding protein [Streptomyces avicenniae]
MTISPGQTPSAPSEPPRDADVDADVDVVVRLDDVRKVYGDARRPVAALDGVSVALRRGSFTAVMGPSGSGKSTFLHCAAGLDRPTSGAVHLDGVALGPLRERALTELRRERIGFVFQAFNLLPALSVTDNVTLPLRLAGRRPDRRAVREVLERVGLGHRRHSRPGELSGGQQQRVAVARALVTRPAVLFGDEPTGALDSTTAREVLGLLREAVEEAGQTVVMVTHDPVAAARADRVLFLADGRLAGSLDAPTADRVAARMTRLGAWRDAAAGSAVTAGAEAAR